MKRIFTLFFFLPLFCGAQEKKQDVFIRIVQDGVSHPLNDFQTNVTLKKKPFKFQVLLNNMEGVYVFSSIKDSVYRFTELSPIQDFSYLKLLELRESDKFNVNREINISETGWSYWFYNDTTEYHTFQRKVVSMGTSGIVCTKYVKELYHTEQEEVVKLKSLNSPLYLFFVAVKSYDSNGVPNAELMRRKVKIDWVDNDD